MVFLTAIIFLWQYSKNNEIEEEDYGIAISFGLIWFLSIPFVLSMILLKFIWSSLKIFLDKSKNL
jgi:hypothetical protein